MKSTTQGMVVTGVVVGVLYAILAETRWSRSRARWRFGLSPVAVTVLGFLTMLIWIATLIFLKPVLFTNFRGLPTTHARYATGAGLLVIYAAYVVALVACYRWIAPRDRVMREPDLKRPDAGGRPSTRRAVVATAAGAVLAYPTYRIIDHLYDEATFPYDGTVYSGPGVKPLVPADQFYTVTKNVVDPDVDRSRWGLEIGGLVDHGHTYSYDEIEALPSVEQETTLMCISNHIGAGLQSNAIWTGVPLRELLTRAGVQGGAVEVKLYGADGYADTFSIDKAMEPTTLVVYKINGGPLPRRHGYPVRMIVPGMFGEKNVKWVTGIDVIDHDGKGFYEEQGWGPNFDVPTRSDIFAPKWTRRRGKDSFDQPFAANQAVEIRGRAFAGNRGVKGVDISLDDGKTWKPTRIQYAGTKLTWSFWSYTWTPLIAGDYMIVCRATDMNGDVQTSEVRGIAPEGATGWQRIAAHVQ